MERIDDLQYHGLHLIQDTDSACFSEDAVYLANFLRLTASDRAIDLGAGNGILSILGQAKTGASFVGVDMQAALCNMASRSAKMNGQAIDFRCMDVVDAPDVFGHGSFSAVVCNPPYFTAGDRSENPSRAAARHGDNGALDAFLATAFLLLKNGGKIFLCYPMAQLCDIFCALREHRLEPKRLKTVATKRDTVPTLALIEAKKDAKAGLIVETPIVVMKNE